MVDAEQPDSPSAQRGAKTFLVAVTCLNTQFFSGGVVQGWPGLEYILQQDGVFASDSSELQQDKFQEISTLGFLALSIASVFFGLMLDRIGPRVVAVVGCVIMAGGNFLLAYPPSDAFYKWALFLLSFGGIGPYLANITFASLFEGYESLFISVICSLFNAAGFNFLLMRELYQHYNISLRFMCSIYGLASLGGAAVCFLCYPNKSYKPGDRCEIPLLSVPCCSARPSALKLQEKSYMFNRHRSLLQPSASLRRNVFTWKFCLLCIVYSFSLLFDAFYPSSINNQLQLKDPVPACVSGYSNTSVSHHCDDGTYWEPAGSLSGGSCVQCAYQRYSNMMVIVSNLGFIANPLVGLLITAAGFVPVFLLCNLATQGYLAILLLPQLSVTPISFALFAIQRSLLFTGFLAFIAAGFDRELYGTLVAIITAVAAILGTLQFAMTALVESVCLGDYTLTNILQLLVIVPCYALPSLLWWQYRKLRSGSLADVDSQVLTDVATLSEPLNPCDVVTYSTIVVDCE